MTAYPVYVTARQAEAADTREDAVDRQNFGVAVNDNRNQTLTRRWKKLISPLLYGIPEDLGSKCGCVLLDLSVVLTRIETNDVTKVALGAAEDPGLPTL
jgi:hypothetical protein